MDRNKNVEYVDKRVNKDIDQFQQLRNKRFILVHLDKKSIMSEYLSGRYYNFSLIQWEFFCVESFILKSDQINL